MEQKWITTAISFKGADADLHGLAKAKAASQRRSFSNYVTGLIEADLRAAGLWPPKMELQEVASSSPDVSARLQAKVDAVKRVAYLKPRRAGKSPVLKPPVPSGHAKP